TVELMQKQSAAGTNQVNIQVVRPPGVGGQGRALPIGTGATQVTWTSADVTIRASGPAQATVGSTITYRLDVTNPSDSPIGNVIASDQVPPGLEFVDSNPIAADSGGVRQWRLNEMPAKGTNTIEANYRVTQAGTVNFCAS